MRYAAHENLVAPARPTATPLRLIGGVVLLAALFMALALTWSILHRAILGPVAGLSAEALQRADTPAAVLVNLYLFGLLILALWATLRLVHRRGLGSLIGPLPLALRQFRRAVLALALLFAVLALVPQPPRFTPIANLEFGRWALYLLPALAGLLLQVSAEEMVFRGYLQSQLAARFSHPVVWMGLPVIVFALLHHAPASFGGNNALVIVWAGVFGLAAADLTARAGSLGPAIALHLINNVAAILLVAPQGSFDGLALYAYPFAADDPQAVRAWLPVDLMTLLCSWLAVRLSLRR